VFGGRPAAGGGYDFPRATAQAFLNQYMVNGGEGYIVGPDGAKVGPNEDEAAMPGFDPLTENEPTQSSYQAVKSELASKAKEHGLAPSPAGQGMHHMQRAHGTGHRTVTVRPIDHGDGTAGLEVVKHQTKQDPGTGREVAAYPSSAHVHPTVDAALAHARKLHAEAVDAEDGGTLDEAARAERDTLHHALAAEAPKHGFEGGKHPDVAHMFFKHGKPDAVNESTVSIRAAHHHKDGAHYRVAHRSVKKDKGGDIVANSARTTKDLGHALAAAHSMLTKTDLRGDEHVAKLRHAE
jgi:hypothetical protein